MFKPSEEYTLEECFEKLKYDYSTIKNENDRLQSYTELLQAVLKYHKIEYPPYHSPEEIDY
jgi:hypothetical protein